MSAGYMHKCVGKRRHPNKSSAEDHRGQLVAAGKATKNGTNTYRCNQCQSWHVGGTQRRPRGKKR